MSIYCAMCECVLPNVDPIEDEQDQEYEGYVRPHHATAMDCVEALMIERREAAKAHAAALTELTAEREAAGLECIKWKMVVEERDAQIDRLGVMWQRIYTLLGVCRDLAREAGNE